MTEVANYPGLFKRGGRYSLRTYVPKDLIQTYGRKEVWTSLRTSDLNIARKLARSKAVEFDRIFEEHRRTHPGDSQNGLGSPQAVPPTSDATDIARLSVTLSQAHYRAVKDKDVIDRAELYEQASDDPDAFYRGDLRRLPDTEYADLMVFGDGELTLVDVLSFCWWHWHGERINELNSAISGGNVGQHLQRVEQLLAERKAGPTTKPQRVVLAKAIIEAEIEALADIRKGDEARYIAITSALSMPNPTELVNAVPDDENPMLLDAAAKWCEEKKRSGKWSDRRADACRRTIDLFIEIVGDKRIAGYGKADARDFKEVLCDLPPNHSKLKETRDLDSRSAARKARDIGLKKMSMVNVNKQLTIISGMFDWFIGHYDGVTINPFANATIEVRTNARDEREPFKTSDLKAIFTAPIYVGCRSAVHWHQPGDEILRDSAKFWLPLLGLYTGARLNELCKLKVTDIRKEDGVNFIDINQEAHKDATIDARVKSSASVRHIPIHADLVAFGFLDFAAQRRRDDSERLFPELKPDKYGKLADGFGKHFRRFLESIGVKRNKIDFHSFRHTWTDACLNSRIPDSVTMALKGESRPGTLARYGHGKTDLEILAEEVAKLKVKGVSLTHLRTTPPTS